MKILPLFNNVVLKDIELEETIKSGIVLPTTAQEKPTIAKVIAVGSGEIIDNKLVPLKLKIDDTVLYSKYAGNEFKLDGETYKILNQNDIIAIIED
ncbi:MAG: co-chaperone GroES [Spirochaetales bacterium]